MMNMKITTVYKYFEGSIDDVKTAIARYESEHAVIGKQDEKQDFNTEPAWYSVSYIIEDYDSKI